jgi:hypothetical protein
MCDDSTLRKILLGKPDARRKAGRPKLWWLDSTENDLKWMDARRWRKKSEDRPLCAVIMNEHCCNCSDNTPVKKTKIKGVGKRPI